MSKHICPKCGYKFEDRDRVCNYYLSTYDWHYFENHDENFHVFCDDCGKEFSIGYIRQKPIHFDMTTGTALLNYPKYEFSCKACAKKHNYILGDQTMTDKIYINPLNYTGAKHKLLPFIKQNLPLDCTTLVDVFGGSGELAINLADSFNHVIYNEINPYLYNIIKAFNDVPSSIFVDLVENVIYYYKLDKYNKEGFLECRHDFNLVEHKAFLENDITKSELILAVVHLYVLICHSFNNFLRINRDGKFMVPSGAGRMWFNPSLKQKLIDYINKIHTLGGELELLNQDFKSLDYTIENTFYTIDPPYFVSDDIYSRCSNYKWSEQDEIQLYGLLDEIDRAGNKFMLFNALTCNGKVNHHFKDFIKKYRVISNEDAFYNCNYQRKNGKTQEIVVVNY